MAVFCKIFLSFESQFWDDIGEIYIASEKRGKYPYWRPIKNDINANLIMSVVTGEEAKRVERLSEDQIKDEIMVMLFEVYGQKDQNPSDFRPLRAHACKWDTDSRFCGSYSFLPVKAYIGYGYQ
jgi:polyamine oxidase